MSKNFINLDQMVRDWAWQEFDNTATGRQRKLRQKDKKEPRKYLRLEIDWSEARFHDETKWSPLRQEEGAVDKPVVENNVGSTGGAAVRHEALPQSSDPRAAVLFQTRFTNNTKDVQEYTMKTEKRTTTSMTTNVENGYTRGVEMSVRLAAPGEVFEANAGYKREFTLTQSDGETFEEELTWGVESVIRVNSQHVAEASLVVDERKQSGDFVVVSKISGPVYATWTSPRDNNSLVKATCNDIVNIAKEYLELERKKGRTVEYARVDDSTQTLIVETKGQCKFRYGVKQEIRVDQKPLNAVK